MKLKIQKYRRKNFFNLEENDLKLIELINQILDILNSKFVLKIYPSPGEILLTGGFIRDRIKKKKIHDYDFVFKTEIFLEFFLVIKEYELDLNIKEFHFQKNHKEINSGLLTIKFEDLYIQIKERKYNLKNDLESRDFSINALYYDIFDEFILDYCNGMSDLLNNRLITINSIERTFNDSFERFFRFSRFLADFNAKEDIIFFVKNYFKKEKFLQVFSDKSKLNNIKRQLGKIFYCCNTAIIIKNMMELGIFEIFFNKSFFKLEKGNKK